VQVGSCFVVFCLLFYVDWFLKVALSEGLDHLHEKNEIWSDKFFFVDLYLEDNCKVVSLEVRTVWHVNLYLEIGFRVAMKWTDVASVKQAHFR